MEAGAGLDLTGLTSVLTVQTFQGIISDVLPIIGVAVLTGFVFYCVSWSIKKFRGI